MSGLCIFSNPGSFGATWQSQDSFAEGSNWSFTQAVHRSHPTVPVPGGRGLTFKDGVGTIEGFYVSPGGVHAGLSVLLVSVLPCYSSLSLFLEPGFAHTPS